MTKSFSDLLKILRGIVLRIMESNYKNHRGYQYVLT